MLLVFGQAYLSGLSVLIYRTKTILEENGQLRNVKFAMVGLEVEMVGVRSWDGCRLAPVFKTIFHQCVISYTCSRSNFDGSELSLKQTHQS